MVLGVPIFKHFRVLYFGLKFLKANSADPDQMQYSVVSKLSLLCLPLKKGSQSKKG